MPRRAEDRGDINETKPAQTRKILKLARANGSDVFYDLGCGSGRVCIIAAEKVKLAVGIEDYKPTYRETKRAVRKAGLAHKVWIRNSNVQKARIGNATIVYTILKEAEADVYRYERVLKKGCRFVTQDWPLIGIKPDERDGPFYMMKMPFRHAKDETDWVQSFMKGATPDRFFDKVKRDYTDGREYAREIRSILRRRLKRWNSV